MRRLTRQYFTGLAAVLVWPLCLTPDASAQSPPQTAAGTQTAGKAGGTQTGGTLERANALAGEAFRLSREGDLEAAIAKYHAALELAPELHGARFALARIFAGLSRFEEARVEFATLVAANPGDGVARRGEATALILLGRWTEAQQRLEEGVRANLRDGQLAHLLARVMSSAPEDAVRDGARALELAMRVYDVQKKAIVGETIAMAFAELGEFERALAIQREMIKIVEAAGDERLLAVMRERLAAYTRREAWRAESPLEIVQSTELPVAGE